MKWLGYLGALLLIIACFLKWVVISSKNIIVTGLETTGTSFGKPAYFHFLLTALFLVFHSIPKIWAKRANIIVAAINLAWAIRNYFVITLCRGGDCPDKQAGIYLILISAVVMLVAALFPDIKMPKEKTNA
jgi:hypothetical protein